MVLRIGATGSETLDLFNAADNYGLEDDRVRVLDSFGPGFDIATYDGNDILRGNNLGGAFHAGQGNDSVYAGSGNDTVAAGGGNDIAYLGQGNDDLYTDTGDDIYYGGAGIDMIHLDVFNIESAIIGDPYAGGVTLDLAITAAQDLGELGSDRFFGFESIFGSGGNDKFYGTDGGNGIEGRDGNDYIDARGGNDTLFGYTGKDRLIGGAGADLIVMDDGPGAPARDVAAFLTLNDSKVAVAGRDQLQSFDAGGGVNDDRIDLSAIDADPLTAGDQAFAFVAAFTAAPGEVRVATVGSDSLVLVDIDADAAAEMAILVLGVTGLAATDFIL